MLGVKHETKQNRHNFQLDTNETIIQLTIYCYTLQYKIFKLLYEHANGDLVHA